MCAGSLASLEVTDLPTLTAFQRGVDRRLGHEVMWEVYAASYDRILPELPFYQEVVERHYAAMSNPAISTVLDIGAGTGSVTVRLLGAGKWVTAVDVNRAMLEKMASKREPGWGDRLTVIEDTAERLPHLRDGAFDGVTVLLAFFDMDDPIAALAEAQRVLEARRHTCRYRTTSLLQRGRAHDRRGGGPAPRGLLDRLSGDWKRIQTVAPLIRDAVQDTRSRKVAAAAKQDWHAEAIFDTLRRDGFTGLTFQEAHLGNCASITGSKGSLGHASPAPLPARAEVWHERAMARRLEFSGKFAPAERPKWRAESSQLCPKTTSGSVVIDAISSWGSRPGRPARSSPVPGAQPN